MDMGASGDDLSRESKKVQGLIFQMTTSVSSFKRAVDSLGTGKDTRELRAKLNKQRRASGGPRRSARSRSSAWRSR